MLGCVSLKNFGFGHSENQIGGDTIKYKAGGTLPIFYILPLGGHYYEGGHYSLARSTTDK